MRRTLAGLVVGCLAAAVPLLAGCQLRNRSNCPHLTENGIYIRDVMDPPAQKDADELMNLPRLVERAVRIKEQVKATAPPGRPPRNVLCLSGGGSLGAYSAGVLNGWTEHGDRPTFDVVTGISTGSLIAPFAFLGPKYDAELKRFYTTSTNRDIYKKTYVRGVLGGESLADSAPLRAQIEEMLTPQMIAEVAEAYRQGRRLYIGTTTVQGKRFIVWDVTAMAARNGPGDRELIRDVLLASASIPGFFPAVKIDISLDGKCYTELHVDGGVSQAIFFRPPYVPPEQRNDPAAMNLAGTRVWAIVAGKLFADPEDVKERALAYAGKSVSTIIYAQTRGDLQRMFLISLLNGMDMYMTAIPAGFFADPNAAEFDPEEMTRLFEEGRRQVLCGTAWRDTPPGTLEAEGETIQIREGRCLTHQVRGPLLPIRSSRGRTIPPFYPLSDRGIPAVPPLRQ